MFGVKIEDKLDTIIGSDTEVKGDVSVRSSLRVDGRVEGNVSVIETLFTGDKSVIHGEVHCKDGILAGRIEGNVFATGTIELQGRASVVGDVRCRNLVLDREAFLDGRVKMSEE